MQEQEIKKAVRERYADRVTQQSSCCPPPESQCCGAPSTAAEFSKDIGYSDEELGAVAAGFAFHVGGDGAEELDVIVFHGFGFFA